MFEDEYSFLKAPVIIGVIGILIILGASEWSKHTLEKQKIKKWDGKLPMYHPFMKMDGKK